MLIGLILFMHENKISIEEMSKAIDGTISRTCRMMFGKGRLWPEHIEKIRNAYPKIKDYGYEIFSSTYGEKEGQLIYPEETIKEEKEQV